MAYHWAPWPVNTKATFGILSILVGLVIDVPLLRIAVRSPSVLATQYARKGTTYASSLRYRQDHGGISDQNEDQIIGGRRDRQPALPRFS